MDAVRREDRSGATWLVLDRPDQRNALTSEMIEALRREIDRVAGDPAVRVLVLAATGPVFCAGHDLREMRALRDRDALLDLFRRCSRMMMGLRRLPQPVVARVQGTATAAGCQLVAMCDLVVAAPEAKFAVSGINVGLFCSTPSVALSRQVGRKAALEMLMTGESIDAGTARDRGLVNRIAAPGKLDEEVERLVASLLAKSPAALRSGKRLFYEQADLDIERAYERASEVMAEDMTSEDAGEGIDAFIAKRTPVWRGR